MYDEDVRLKNLFRNEIPNVNLVYVAVGNEPSQVGFNTVSRYISFLVGNMMTDSASAAKYWYFIGVQASKSLLEECVLRT